MYLTAYSELELLKLITEYITIFQRHILNILCLINSGLRIQNMKHVIFMAWYLFTFDKIILILIHEKTDFFIKYKRVQSR